MELEAHSFVQLQHILPKNLDVFSWQLKSAETNNVNCG